MTIDPKTPAKIVFVAAGKTFSSGAGFTLESEREFVNYLRRTRKDFTTYGGLRPMCIVRLKALK